MATINMQGHYNIRIKGLKINSNIYPIIELYFNLGSALNVGDHLNFGTLEDWGYDLQIRMNTIGTSWDFTVTAGIRGGTTLSFSPINETDLTTDIILNQTVHQGSGGNVTIRPRFMTTQSDVLGFSHINPIYTSTYIEWYSPIIVLHDEFSDKLLILSDAARSPIFCSSPSQSPNNIIRESNGVPVTNRFPIVYSISVNPDIIIKGFIDNILETVNPSDSDPYNPNSEHGGGDGETQTTDSITDPALPTITSVDTGFVTLYKPSVSQLNNLASWMWGSLDVDLFKRVMQSPMDAILGLSILPGIVPSGSSSSVKIGNIDSGVSMPKLSSQYVKFDCGSLTVKRKWGAFLDYSPYTKTYLYLPFIGIRAVETDSIMNTEVQVKYNIDVMSGACCAFVIANGTTLYSFIGQCSCSVPVTGRDWTNLINGVLGAVSGVASAAGSASSGNIMGAVSGIASAASSALSAKPTIEHSGNMGGMGGLMGIKRPYFIVERPVQAVPGYQNTIIGYPSFVFKRINQLSGYTEFEQIHLEGLPCTNEELDEIENILLTGVIL